MRLPGPGGQRSGPYDAVVRVGLTGGVGSGKSTVSAMLRELGAVVIDADVLAREVVEPGTGGLAAVVEAFGDGVLAADGSLDRAAMGRLVFADEGARRRLEAIVHPLVHQRAAEIEADAPAGALVVHDIPQRAESPREGAFDAVLVIDVPEDEQVRRLVEDRGWTETDARARIAAQATREQRLAIATHVLDNSGDLESLRSQVEALVAELTAR